MAEKATKDKVIKFRLAAETYGFIKSRAAELNMTVSNYILACVRMHGFVNEIKTELTCIMRAIPHPE